MVSKKSLETDRNKWRSLAGSRTDIIKMQSQDIQILKERIIELEAEERNAWGHAATVNDELRAKLNKILDRKTISKEVEDIIPFGWRLHKVDASIDNRYAIMIVRNKSQETHWLNLTEDQQDRIQLYASGAGASLREGVKLAVADISKEYQTLKVDS